MFQFVVGLVVIVFLIYDKAKVDLNKKIEESKDLYYNVYECFKNVELINENI